MRGRRRVGFAADSFWAAFGPNPDLGGRTPENRTVGRPVWSWSAAGGRLLGRRMAATNGYTPEQASDLYVSSGTTRDYEYGIYRIFGFTFEM